MLDGANIVVLDLETLRSADDCQFCEDAQGEHALKQSHVYTRIGWDNTVALGISIGCYFSYETMELGWFDAYTIESLMRRWVDEQPLLVGFNSRAFDLPLMRALLRAEASRLDATDPGTAIGLASLCDAFKVLCAGSYDLLKEIWDAEPDQRRKFERGLNSLDAICRAEGLLPKEMDGATAPKLWAQGRHAEVIQYNANDVFRTKALFEKVLRTGEVVRGDGQPLTLARPEVAPYLAASGSPARG